MNKAEEILFKHGISSDTTIGTEGDILLTDLLEEYAQQKQPKVGDAEIRSIGAKLLYTVGEDGISSLHDFMVGVRKTMELNSNSIDVDALLEQFKKTDGIKVIYTHNLVLHKFADFIKKQLNKTT
jgi:hypothetical protein